MEKRILAIFAHPDDAEFMCAGTLSLLRKAGWKIHIATMTPGDKGSAELTRQKISRIRKAEAEDSAKLLKGKYYCLGFDDVYILYRRRTIDKTIELIREIRPAVVFTASPNDYMVDHEITSKIVQTACFAAGIKNMDAEGKSFEPVPYLYYCDPLDGRDILGNAVRPTIYIDISSEIKIKEKMLLCHKSQREWLLKHHNIDEYIISMKQFAGKRGKEIKKDFAEGFRQHLGNGFPQNNILKELLGEKVIG